MVWGPSSGSWEAEGDLRRLQEHVRIYGGLTACRVAPSPRIVFHVLHAALHVCTRLVSVHEYIAYKYTAIITHHDVDLVFL